MRAELDGAYADAMLMVARYYPAHDDIALLAAEAAMDTLPWDYWEPDKQSAKPRLGEAIRLVETVMARNAEHPQAPHLYIHLMENGPDPKRAEAAADRLAAPLAADAGHMVHMPAHIYYRLGRWKDSIRVNVDAARKDEAYIQAARATRASSATAIIRTTSTSSSPRRRWPATCRPPSAKRSGSASIVDAETATKIAWIQAIHAAPYFATLQFASPADVLAMARARSAPRLCPRRAPLCPRRRLCPAAQPATASTRSWRELNRIRQSDALKPMVDQGVPAPDLLQLAELVARGRFASARGRHGQAADLYRQAIAIEDQRPLYGAALVVLSGPPVARRGAVPRRPL